MEKEKPAAEEPTSAILEGLDCFVEKNKIQLRGIYLFCSLEVENLRGGEESSKSSWSTGQVVRQPAPGNGRTPRSYSLSPAPSARPAHTSRQLRPNTASDCLALKQRCRSPLSAGLCTILVGIPGRKPAPFPHAAGAELLTEQTLVVTSCILPVLYSSTSTITSLPPERYVLLQLATPSEREEIPQPFPWRHPKQPMLSKARGREKRCRGLQFSSSLRVKLHFPGSEWHLHQIVNKPKPGLLQSKRTRLTLGKPLGSFYFAIVKLPLLCRHEGRKETQSDICLKSLPES